MFYQAKAADCALVCNVALKAALARLAVQAKHTRTVLIGVHCSTFTFSFLSNIGIQLKSAGDFLKSSSTNQCNYLSYPVNCKFSRRQIHF